MKTYEAVISQTAKDCQQSQKKIEEAVKLLFAAMRYYITQPHLASRIVLTYFGVLDLNYKKIITILKARHVATKELDYLYELYKKYWS